MIYGNNPQGLTNEDPFNTDPLESLTSGSPTKEGPLPDIIDQTLTNDSSSGGQHPRPEDRGLADRYYRQMLNHRQLQQRSQAQADRFRQIKETAQRQMNASRRQQETAVEMLQSS